MYLKSLSIRGFKSFADKTIIELDPLGGITAIVGPNGCGKSNLVDAVRWVLGEQNPKELRSAALEGVIFAGSTARKPLSLAEVNLTIDNSDNKIKSEFSEISIRRRTYRSGESEFQINKATCRLKDIKDLFLDTGLGSGSYSIISQGQVDELLSSKPEDRRRIFEEAARINKYKFRKKAAERKLISTEQNLLRISDLKGEITNQLSTLSGQAEKAGQHKKLKDSLKNLEIGISKRQLKNVGDREKAIQIKIEELKNQSGKNVDYINQLESEKNKNKETLRHIENDIEDLRIEISKSKLEYEESKSEILLNKEKERHLEEQLTNIREEMKTLSPQLEGLKAELAEKEIIENESREKFNAAENEFNEIKNKVDGLVSDKENLLREIEQLKTDIFAQENIIAEEKNNLIELEGNIRFVNEESRRDCELLVKLEEESKSLGSEQSETNEKLTGIKEKIKVNKSKIDSASISLKNRQEELNALNNNFSDKKEDFDTTSSKHEVLAEFQKTHEGYPRGVREALRIGEEGKLGKVYGTVAELIKIKPEHETAIAVALSKKELSIIVEKDETAKAIIKHLKEKNLGRATFLPINLINKVEIKLNIPSEKGVIDIASNLVNSDGKFKEVIKYMLGRTVVVDNFKNAEEIAKKKVPYQIVTLEGEFIPYYGTMTGGTLAKTNTYLGREKEILELEEKVKSLNADLEILETNKNNTITNISKKESELKALLAVDSKFNIEMVQANQIHESAEQKVNSLKEELDITRSSINARESELNEMERKRNEINDSVSNAETKLKDLILKLENNQKTAQEKGEEKDTHNNEIIELKTNFAKAQTNLKYIFDEISRIKTNINSIENMINIKNGDRLDGMLKETLGSIEKLEAHLPEMQKKEQELAKKLEDTQVQKGTTQREIEMHEEKISLEAGNKLTLKDELSKEEIALSKIESETEAIALKMNEDYGLTLEQVDTFESDVTNITQTKDEIISLKSQITHLGPVNLLAIEEFERAKERISFIETQYNDLIIARENLSNLIGELDSKAKIEFLNTIKIVNEHFSDIFANLFEGGEAKITLSSDENILEGGIDIVAKPGGKKWLSLSVMSGGERALTAIALLFALLRTHPSPFCFLDEVDAALDEANVHRFSRMLKDFAKTTQIILITHNKQTMSIVDTLYGITMGEPGISKVISVKLSKAVA